MGRHSCCLKQKLRKGLWSPEEDEKLFNYITRFGVGCWSSVPKLAGMHFPNSFQLFRNGALYVSADFLVFSESKYFDSHRTAEVWKELQIEMDKLLETRFEERNVLTTRGGSHYQST